MNSPVAETITLIKALMNGTGGISPAPVPVGAVFPYVTVGEVNVKEVESLAGVSGVSVLLVQIDVWDKSHENAWALRKTIKDYLLAKRGQCGTQNLMWVGPNVDAALYDGNRSLHQMITRLQMWWA